MWVKADDMKDHFVGDGFKYHVPKYCKKKRKLEYLSMGLSEYDNPLLMFVTFK